MNKYSRSPIVALCALTWLSGCGHSFVDDMDLSSFQEAPQFINFDLSHLKPLEPYTYVSLNQGLTTPSSLASHGDICGAATIPANCMSDFNSLTAMSGFGECVADECRKYFAVNRGDTNFVVTNRDELLAFFGPIDAAEEALILVNEQGYQWSAPPIEKGAIRAVDDGFEVIAWKYTSTCNPIDSYRYDLHVSAAGVVNILNNEFMESNDGCL